MCCRFRISWFALLVLAPLCGCGSKISEANYYKVTYGMSEEAVEDLLGPPHEEAHEEAREKFGTAATSARAGGTDADVRVKTWSHGPLVIRVRFENGKVAGRGAEGIPKESPMLLAKPATAAAEPA